MTPSLRRTAVRALMSILAIQFLYTGVWALVASDSWYASFPGFGHAWVSGQGPFNAHLTADSGSGFLAVGAGLGLAAAWFKPAVARLALAVMVAHSVPHFLFHLSHPDPALSTVDVAVGVWGIGVEAAVGLGMLALLSMTWSDQEKQGRIRHSHHLRPWDVLGISALIYAAGLVVHTLDHIRRGNSVLTPEVFWAGTASTVAGVTIVALILWRHRWAPVAAAAFGLPVALGVAAVHFLPSWGVISDAFPGGEPRGVTGFSWFAVSTEIVGAVAMSAAALWVLRQPTGLATHPFTGVVRTGQEE